MNMETKIAVVGASSFCTWIAAYFYNLTMDNLEQYLAVLAVLWLDGVLGIWAGCKREGFKTYKALKILKNIKMQYCSWPFRSSFFIL